MPPTTLITCHTNADFDAFASMIAAYYLYPQDSVLLFPGTQERPLNALYATAAIQQYPFIKADAVDWAHIRQLVLVDTRQRARVPHVHAALERASHSALHIIVWDHHPDSPDDIVAHTLHTATVGATVTLILRELRARNIAFDADAATVFALGIYADTGSFTFDSTTAEDFAATAWLREQGMDVTRLADIRTHELTREHIQALSSLLESATAYMFHGASVVMAEASMENYLGDFAYLVHKLMEIEKFEVLFALGRMADRVLVVARSHKGAVNVGQICAALGGGGHQQAASATVRDKTLPEVRDILFRLLFAQAHPEKLARDYMSKPVIGIEEDRNIQAAHELMLRFGLKAVPVYARNSRRCVGILDAQTAARAVGHGLHSLSVDIYMLRRVRTLLPQAPLSELVETIVGARQRLVPIVENDEVIGVVTRTNLINIFVDEAGGVPAPLREDRKERNVHKLMRDRLPKDCLALLEQAGALGDRLGLPVYAVGGFVRDLLLEQPNQDIDLVVEGNGIAYARELAKALNGRVREHKEFLTAVVIFEEAPGQKRRIDVATARLEYYEYPAALPTIELSSIKMDLFRRDFTVNALAIRLSKDVFGLLVDFFGGQRDMRERMIRILHTLSFVEDPTRCLRAVRFEQRYAFRLGPAAEKLVKNAVHLNIMDKVSGPRLFHELTLIFEENNPVTCIMRMDALGLLAAIHPLLALTPQKTELLRANKDIIDWYRLLYFDEQPAPWFIYLLGLCRNLNYQEAAGVFARLGVPQLRKTDMLHWRERIRASLPHIEAWQQQNASARRVSALCSLLANIPLEGLLYMMARSDQQGVRKSLSRYITEWRREKVDLTGDDLKALGLEPGPLFGRIMRRLLAAKLDGEATSYDSQRLLALALALQADGGAQHPTRI